MSNKSILNQTIKGQEELIKLMRINLLIDKDYHTTDLIRSKYICDQCNDICDINSFMKTTNNKRVYRCSKCCDNLIENAPIINKSDLAFLNTLAFKCLYGINGCNEILNCGNIDTHISTCLYKPKLIKLIQCECCANNFSNKDIRLLRSVLGFTYTASDNSSYQNNRQE